MFTIDLLKGQGVPIKSSPGNIAVAAAAVSVPVIIAIVMFGFYLRNRIAISIQKHTMANYEMKIAELSDAIELQKSFEEEKNAYSSCLSEVSSSLGRYTQWSPVLVTLVKNMPDSVVLTGLGVKQHSIRRKVRQKDDPQKMVNISVPVKTLQMTVAARPRSNGDEAIRNFNARLRSSSLLGPKLENIRISQKLDTLEGQAVVSYQIDCIFKPGL